MFKELLLSLGLTCCVGASLMTNIELDHNDSHITTPVKRAQTFERFTQFEPGYIYQFNVQALSNYILSLNPFSVNTSPVTLLTFNTSYINSNNYFYTSFESSLDDYEISQSLEIYYTYYNNECIVTLGTDADDYDLFTIDSSWSLSNVHRSFFLLSVSFNYRADVDNPAYSRIGEAPVIVTDIYNIRWRDYFSKLSVQRILNNSSFVMLDWNRIATALNSYHNYQHLVIKGLWTRADKDSTLNLNFFEKNQVYKELHVWKYSQSGVTRYAVEVISTNNKYTKIYTNQALGFGSSMLQVLSTITMDINVYNVDYGYNFILLNPFESFAPIVDDFTFNDLAITLVDTPLYTLFSLFNVNLFGVNMFVLVTGLLTAILVVWLIRKFI